MAAVFNVLSIFLQSLFNDISQLTKCFHRANTGFPTACPSGWSTFRPIRGHKEDGCHSLNCHFPCNLDEKRPCKLSRHALRISNSTKEYLPTDRPCSTQRAATSQNASRGCGGLQVDIWLESSPAWLPSAPLSAASSIRAQPVGDLTANPHGETRASKHGKKQLTSHAGCQQKLSQKDFTSSS